MRQRVKTRPSDRTCALRSVFRLRAIPCFSMQRRNRHIGSLDAELLKSPGRICSHCNNTRTQPYDLAWDKLSAALRTRTPAIAPGDIVRLNRIFPYGTAREMRNVHLYFVKLFGCHIAGNPIPLDIGGFADAIMHGRAHPCVYLNFGCGPKPLPGNQ